MIADLEMSKGWRKTGKSAKIADSTPGQRTVHPTNKGPKNLGNCRFLCKYEQNLNFLRNPLIFMEKWIK